MAYIATASVKRHTYTGEVSQVKVKVTFNLEQAKRAQRGSRCVALPFL
jgi:ribosomal protein S28E/S33